MAFQDVLIGVALLARRQEDSGAGMGVGLGVVMVQRNAQMPAHIGQRGRTQIPDGSGYLDGTNEGLLSGSTPVASQQARSTERSNAALCAATKSTPSSFWAASCHNSPNEG